MICPADGRECSTTCEYPCLPVRRNDTGVRTVSMPEDVLAFALRNCETNRAHGLAILQSGEFKRETCERVVEMIENFKLLEECLKKAK